MPFEPVSVAVPVFRGRETFRELHHRLRDTLARTCADHEIQFPIWDILFGSYFWDIEVYPSATGSEEVRQEP